MLLTGSNILLEGLKKEGVEIVFGYPGGVVIDLFDKIPSHPEIKHILVRHEQAAVHAADGYARATGKVGVALATSGPGATNTVTGIATAYCDSIPMVVVTGQVPVPLIGNDAFQEVDIIGITRPITKHNFLVKDVRDLARTIKQAFHIARTGRPGPVLIDLPKDVMHDTCEFVWEKSIKMRSYNPTYKANVHQLKVAAEILGQAKRPLILSGGGVIMSDAWQELRALAELIKAPVSSTIMGLGAFDGNHNMWLGMPGMHGTYEANKAINNADVILAIGMRFDDRVTGRVSAFAPKAKIIHIDVDPTTIHKNVNVEVPVVGDCRHTLNEMLERFSETCLQKNWAKELEPWHAQIAAWRNESALSWQKGNNIKPQQVIEHLCRLAQPDAIVATDVGQHQMWTAQFFRFRSPRTFLTSGGLGTMGYGLPAAIGAQMACPTRQVILISGDGSIQMNSQELMTAVYNKLPIKIIILNNGYLGMVRQWQQLFWNGNYVATDMLAQPNFVKLAEAYGASGVSISTEKELNEKLPFALQAEGLVIVDIKVEREENVYPMVPAGAALDEMLLA